jgi:HK97 family phage portal protein
MFHVRGAVLPGCDRGISPIGMERNIIGNALAGEKSAGRVYKKGLISTTFLLTDQTLKPEQRKQMGDTLAGFLGSDNAGGVAVLEHGFTPMPISINPKDAQLLEARQYSVEQICRIFGVPPVMIGHAANGTTTWGSGIEQLILQFTKTCLTPMLRSIESAVYRDLLDVKTRKTTVVKFNMEGLLRGDSAARASFLSQMVNAGIYTPDEARAYENKAAMDGGDRLIVQGAMVPLETLGEVPPAPVTEPANDNNQPKPAVEQPKRAA